MHHYKIRNVLRSPRNFLLFAWANLWGIILRINPSYTGKHYSIHFWLFEFDDEGFMLREVGLGVNDQVIGVASDERNIGMWCGQNIYLSDITDQSEAYSAVAITSEYFEECWAKSRGKHLQAK
jgi:hypothetical protein